MQDAQNQKVLLRLDGVLKDFSIWPPGRALRALDAVSFEVRSGQIVGLVGPNGSGKTTAFRVAAGLLKPNSGEARVFDKRPDSLQARSMAGYMPETPGLPGTLKPREILEFVGQIFNIHSRQRKLRIQELADLLAMNSYINRRMSRLSKGMTQRVSLAIALFNAPRLLLLDEPLEGIDPLGAAGIKDHLKHLARNGAGILISSHILSDIEALCEKIIIIDKGKVVLRGDGDAILAVRDRLEVCFRAPSGTSLLEEVSRFIETRGGKIEFAGHPREELETLFKKVVGKASSTKTEAPQ